MSPIALTINVPMPPTITNSAHGRSRHWRALETEKNQYWNKLNLLAACNQIPKPPDTPFPRASLRSRMHLGGAMDDDNALARHKWLLDWLVHAKYLAGDRKKHILWESLPEQIVKRDGHYRIVLTLSPISHET